MTSRPRATTSKTPQLSAETLNACAVLLSQVTLSPNADDFEEQARVLGKARRELIAALAAEQG